MTLNDLSNGIVPQNEDAVKLLADKLRTSRQGIKHGEAVFRGNRMDFFRSKDFTRHFKKNSDELKSVVEGGKVVV